MQKSKIQEMFPVNTRAVRRYIFFRYWAISVAFVPALAAIAISIMHKVCPFMDYASRVSALHMLFAACVVWVIAAIGWSYVLANRFMRDFYFDITDNSIVMKRVLFGLQTVPFSEVLDIVVHPTISGLYVIDVISITSWLGRNYPVCCLYYFDKNTAFALKNYIVEKMRNAKKSGE